MVKNIRTIIFNSMEAVKTSDLVDTNLNFNIDVPPIIIKDTGILKVANFCHIGTATNHTDNMYLFRINGIIPDNSRLYTGRGGSGNPLILTTTFNNNRSLYDENIITLTRQTINNINISVDTYLPSGNFNSVNITNGGSSYLVGQVLTFTGGGASTNMRINTINSGAITSLSLFGSSGIHTSTPTLTTSINGSGAILVANIFANSISSITITNAGAGYKAGQTLEFSGGGGTGANISIATVDALGAILTFTLTAQGSGYTSAPTVSVNSTTQTQTAQLYPQMNYGIITNGLDNKLNFSITFTIEQDEF